MEFVDSLGIADKYWRLVVVVTAKFAVEESLGIHVVGVAFAIRVGASGIEAEVEEKSQAL